MSSNKRYSLEEELHGEGGFGKVHKGRDTILDRAIALKVLDPLAQQFDETDRERFLREAKILASLSHPAIPAIYDVLISEEEFSIVLEFVDGRTLADLMDEDGPCSLVEAKSWFEQIASVLNYAQSKGVVHRDVTDVQGRPTARAPCRANPHLSGNPAKHLPAIA